MVLKIEIEHKLLPKTILYYNILHFLHNVGKKPDPNTKIKYKIRIGFDSRIRDL